VPTSDQETFVLVLHGVWPDAEAVQPPETRNREREYWTWASDLADRGLLVAAGDLRWEPGERILPGGAAVRGAVAAVDDPDFVVGMFTLRADSYEAAVALAEGCPHLRYGGSVSVRQVGAGFVTVPGMGDWSQ
jgi:hypothetical protein